MKNNWEETTLNDICKIERGSSPRPIDKFFTNDKNGVNWIKIGDVSENDKYVTQTKQKITKDGAEKSRFVEIGDFILSNSMSYGRPYIMKIKGCIHDGWFVLRINKNLINQDFLYILLSSSIAQGQYNKLAAGSVVKNISSDLIKKVKIPLPPLQQQKQIVEKLDKAFENIDKLTEIAKQNLENSKELFNSYLNKIFTQNNNNWEETTLNDICKIERGSSPRPIDKFITNDKDGINWIKIGDVSENDKYVTKTKQKITKIGAEKSRFVYIGDFILSNSMSYGRPYIMKINGCIHDGWFVLRTNKNLINSDFLYILLSSSIAQEQYNKLAVGSVVKNISGDLIKKVKIPLPPLPQQKQIVKILDNLQEKTKKLEQIYNKKVELAKELKQSILHKELQPKV